MSYENWESTKECLDEIYAYEWNNIMDHGLWTDKDWIIRVNPVSGEYDAINGHTKKIIFTESTAGAVIQDVMAVIPVYGASIGVSSGTFLGDFIIDKNYVRISGQGRGATVFTGKITISASVREVCLENFGVKRTGAPSATGIYIYSATNIVPLHLLRNLKIEDCSSYGVYIENVSDCHFDNVICIHNGYGLYALNVWKIDTTKCYYYSNTVAGAYFGGTASPCIEGGVMASGDTEPDLGELILDGCFPVKISGVWFENQFAKPNIDMISVCGPVSIHGVHVSNKDTAPMINVRANGFDIKGVFVDLAAGGSDHVPIYVVGTVDVQSFGEIGEVILGGGILTSVYARGSYAKVQISGNLQEANKAFTLLNMDVVVSNCGIDNAVDAGATTYTDMILPMPEPDANYAIVATADFDSPVWATLKTETGFRLNYHMTGTWQSKISWMLFRQASG